MAQALVPLKDLVEAKSRLSGLLRPSERRALAQAMVEDVLQALASHPAIERITLLSDDPGAHLLASRYGADYWPEAEFCCRGLNPLLQRASERLLQRESIPLLVLHGDLPLLKPRDISAVLAAWRSEGGLVIGSDLHGTGTNLLAFDEGGMPPFRFGPGSCARHLEAARAAGIPARVLQREGIALDVDEPPDLARLLSSLARYPGGKTAKLLLGTALGERIGLALESLPDTGYDTGDQLGQGGR